MTFEELFNKYMSNEDFKNAILLEAKTEGLQKIIVKHNLPYSEEELKELIISRFEAANCESDTVLYSVLSVGVGCIVSAIRDGKMTKECVA